MNNSGKHWKLSEETKKRMSIAQKGKKVSAETRLKLSILNKGKKKLLSVSEKTKEKLSIASKRFYANGGKSPMGMLGRKASPETIRKLVDSHKGIPVPSRQGSKCHFWKGGVTPEHTKIRMSLNYNNWRNAIFEKNNFACVLCGNDEGGKLRAHHIKNFSDYSELRFAIDNGITFCDKCHNEFHSKYGRKNNTKEQMDKFFDIRHETNFTGPRRGNYRRYELPPWGEFKKVMGKV